MRGKSETTAVEEQMGEAFPVDVTWLSPDSELWVASSSTDFVGVIEFRDGHFVARDSRNRSLGSFSDLRRAKLAVQGRWERRSHPSLGEQLTGFAARLRVQPRAETVA